MFDRTLSVNCQLRLTNSPSTCFAVFIPLLLVQSEQDSVGHFHTSQFELDSMASLVEIPRGLKKFTKRAEACTCIIVLEGDHFVRLCSQIEGIFAPGSVLAIRQFYLSTVAPLSGVGSYA